MKASKVIVALVSLFLIYSLTASATQKVALNAPQVKADNAVGEDIVCERTDQSPAEVKLLLNPHIEHASVCTAHAYEHLCGYNSAYCGYFVRRICNHGVCHDYYYPNYCCFDRQYCVKYDDVASTVYNDVTLKFKKSLPVPTGATDVFDVLTSSDLTSVDVKVVSSGKPYVIKKKNNVFSFEQSKR